MQRGLCKTANENSGPTGSESRGKAFQHLQLKWKDEGSAWVGCSLALKG